MKRSIVRDAIGCELFYFRKDVLSGDDSNKKEDMISSSHDDEYTKMSVDTIFNGNVRRCISDNRVYTTYYSLYSYSCIYFYYFF